MKNNETKFKETEIGIIPEEWEVLGLKKIAEPIKDAYLPNSEESLNYIGLEHIDQQTLSLNSVGTSSDVTSTKFKFEAGDILFGKLRPYFRKVYRPRFSGISSTDILVMRAKENINQGWLFYFLANEDFIKAASGGSGGTRMPRADWHHLENTVWPVPIITEQKQIAEILSSLDDKIELNRKINANLEKLASSLFKKWFVDIGDELPEGWTMEPLSSFGKIVCGKTPSKAVIEFFNGEVPFIKIPDMHGSVFIVNTEDSLTESGADSQKNKIIPPDSICVSCIATVGLVSMTTIDSQTNQQINSVIPAKSFYQLYLFNALKNLEGYLQRMGSSGSATLNVNTTSFSLIEVLKPRDNVLEEFDSIVRPMFDQIKTNTKQNLALSEIRDSLLPRLMSGKIRT